MTNMVTFLILMRIDRAEGSQSYLEKSRALVLKALSQEANSPWARGAFFDQLK